MHDSEGLARALNRPTPPFSPNFVPSSGTSNQRKPRSGQASSVLALLLGLGLTALAPVAAAQDAKAGAEKSRRQQAAIQAMQRRFQEEKAAVAAELDTTKQALVGAQAAAERAREEHSALKRELMRLRQDLGKSLGSARAQDVVVQQLESARNDLARRLEAIEEERRGLQSRLVEAENQLANARFTISAQKGQIAEQNGMIAEQNGMVAEQKGQIAELDTERAALGRQLTAAGEESRRAQQVIARSDGARAGLERSLAEVRQQLQSCDNNRQGLDRTARELLLRYEQKTCQTALMQAEPFLQLRRVTIESEVERYRETIDGFRVNSSLPPQR
jgi:chromosome segregation ATPase